MPRKSLKRIEDPNHARFVTFSCRHRLPLFSDDWAKDLFIMHLDKVRSVTGCHLIAFVVMPEHVHLLLWPKLPDFPAISVLHRLKRNAAKEIVGRWRDTNAPILHEITDTNGNVRLWQPGGGYDRNISTDEELREKIDYIHANPVHRGLVDKPTDYHWSSARWYSDDTNDTLPMDRAEKPN